MTCSSTPASTHLFVDDSLPTYDAEQTAEVVDRILAFAPLR